MKDLTLKIVLSATFISLGLALPFLTGNIPYFGNMLCPMHIPIIIAGFVLGPWYGLSIGLVTPILRSFLFGMPPFYPSALCMSFELATYGLVSGLLYNLLSKTSLKHIVVIFISLVAAQLIGRGIWGVSRMRCGLFPNTKFTWQMFLSGGFITAWPGIILQLVLIPPLVIMVNRRLSYRMDNKNSVAA